MPDLLRCAALAAACCVAPEVFALPDLGSAERIQNQHGDWVSIRYQDPASKGYLGSRAQVISVDGEAAFYFGHWIQDDICRTAAAFVVDASGPKQELPTGDYGIAIDVDGRPVGPKHAVAKDLHGDTLVFTLDEVADQETLGTGRQLHAAIGAAGSFTFPLGGAIDAIRSASQACAVALRQTALPIPTYEIDDFCDATAARLPNKSARDMCINQEQDAYDWLKYTWARLPTTTKRECATTPVRGQRWKTYSSLLDCIVDRAGVDRLQMPAPHFKH